VKELTQQIEKNAKTNQSQASGATSTSLIVRTIAEFVAAAF
jgi:hypothetical protein